MTITTKYGNLLDAKGILVHGCNCQGVMGSGVALQIKQKWPTVFSHYQLHHRSNSLFLGSAYFVNAEIDVCVCNAITQKFYGREPGKVYVSYDAVRDAFNTVNMWALRYGYETINFPLIGCGLAGGDWSVVSSIIDEELDDSLEKVLWLQP